MKRLTWIPLSLLLSSATVFGEEPPPTFLLEWGTAGSAPGQFADPRAAAADANGNLYVVSIDKGEIYEIHRQQ